MRDNFMPAEVDLRNFITDLLMSLAGSVRTNKYEWKESGGICQQFWEVHSQWPLENEDCIQYAKKVTEDIKNKYSIERLCEALCAQYSLFNLDVIARVRQFAYRSEPRSTSDVLMTIDPYWSMISMNVLRFAQNLSKILPIVPESLTLLINIIQKNFDAMEAKYQPGQKLPLPPDVHLAAEVLSRQGVFGNTASPPASSEETPPAMSTK